jgi:hypothetical protein
MSRLRQLKIGSKPSPSTTIHAKLNATRSASPFRPSFVRVWAIRIESWTFLQLGEERLYFILSGCHTTAWIVIPLCPT